MCSIQIFSVLYRRLSIRLILLMENCLSKYHSQLNKTLIIDVFEGARKVVTYEVASSSKTLILTSPRQVLQVPRGGKGRIYRV